MTPSEVALIVIVLLAVLCTAGYFLYQHFKEPIDKAVIDIKKGAEKDKPNVTPNPIPVTTTLVPTPIPIPVTAITTLSPALVPPAVQPAVPPAVQPVVQPVAPPAVPPVVQPVVPPAVPPVAPPIQTFAAGTTDCFTGDGRMNCTTCDDVVTAWKNKRWRLDKFDFPQCTEFYQKRHETWP